MMETEQFLLHENGWVPNNDRLPVLVYRGVVHTEGDKAAQQFEKMFADHGWPPQWRDTVYDYHHYHSTAHEALGIAAGSGTLMLGGPGGRKIAVSAGDALVLPVGTGHRRLDVSDDFLVVGAYPQGQGWDIRRDAPSAETRRHMHALAIPNHDPVAGASGVLTEHWHEQERAGDN
ncbi:MULTISPECIES: cupin [Sphingomonadaceae]|uniref:cupin n=1 Tax=Sphingomonadales TaxID=204457 RepID=UPI000A9B1CDC|nr:cupin [Sphingobium sp. TKS]MCF8707632.1 cupin [Rhizorhapis sp. SPR117]